MEGAQEIFSGWCWIRKGDQGQEGERESRAEMSLHFWSLGLVFAVKELGESPPLNGMNTAREDKIDSEGAGGDESPKER